MGGGRLIGVSSHQRSIAGKSEMQNGNLSWRECAHFLIQTVCEMCKSIQARSHPSRMSAPLCVS